MSEREEAAARVLAFQLYAGDATYVQRAVILNALREARRSALLEAAEVADRTDPNAHDIGAAIRSLADT